MIRIFSQNVVLPTGDDGLRVGPALVDVDGSMIASVTELSHGSWGGGPVLDLGERLLSPAFTNGHTHLPMSALRGLTCGALGGNVVEDLFFKVETRLSASDIRAFARLGALECLLSGTGAVFEHYYGGLQLAAGLRDVGLSGVVAPTLQDRAGPGHTRWRQQLDDTVAIAEDASLAADGLLAGLGPHATDTVSSELWSLVCDVAEAHALPVHVHVAQSFEEVQRSYDLDGVSPVQGLVRNVQLHRIPRLLMVHGLYVSDADLDALDPAKVVLGYCPSSQLLFEFPAHVQSWRERGFPLVLGTDAGACNDGMNVQRELSLLASGAAFGASLGAAHSTLRERGTLRNAKGVRAQRRQAYAQWSTGAGAAELLRSVWQVPGDLHPGLRVGRIAPGYRANLVAWDLDHPSMWPGRDPLRGLAYGSVQGAMYAMWVNGCQVGDIGDVAAVLRTDDVRAMVREASERLDRVLQGV